MSSAFVSSEPVPVGDDEGNTIYILPKMPYGVKQRVTHAMFHLEAKTEAGDLVVQDNVEVDLATHNLLLLKANVTSWHGPAFGDTPFSADALERLDPDFSLLDKVLSEINARNYVAKKSRAAKNGSGGGGHESSAAHLNSLPEIGTGTSSSRTASGGRRKK